MVSMNLMSAKCERIVSSLPTSESVKYKTRNFLSVNRMFGIARPDLVELSFSFSRKQGIDLETIHFRSI